MSEPLTPEAAKEQTTFSLYRKTARTLISDTTFPPGTAYQTPEGLRAEDEETRAAFDVQGGIYPIRESVFQQSYALDAAGAPASTPDRVVTHPSQMSAEALDAGAYGEIIPAARASASTTDGMREAEDAVIVRMRVKPMGFHPVDLTELMNEGVLFAANERFFWPLGLALTWNYDKETGEASGLHLREWRYEDGHAEAIGSDESDPVYAERRGRFVAWLAARTSRMGDDEASASTPDLETAPSPDGPTTFDPRIDSGGRKADHPRFGKEDWHR